MAGLAVGCAGPPGWPAGGRHWPAALGPGLEGGAGYQPPGRGGGRGRQARGPREEG